MKEVEITVQVFDEYQNIDKILKSQGYSMIENYQLNDWYFTTLTKSQVKKIGYKTLMKHSFLVREILDEKPKVQLCYKNKKIDKQGNVVEEVKTVAKVDDVKKTLQIFESAKVNNWCKLSNNSFVYKKDEIEFCVQIIEGLGIFIEYENDETMKNMTSEQMFEQEIKVVSGLGLKLGTDFSCKKVYMKLKKTLDK